MALILPLQENKQQMMKRRLLSFTSIIMCAIAITSCKKDNDTPGYTVPTTYTFDNVEYAEASGRVSMWLGFTAWLGRSTGRELSQDSANYLWNNTNNAFTAENASNLPFSVSAINALGFNLSSKTADAVNFKQWIDSMVKVSKSYQASASNGVAGKVGSRLVNYTGVEFNQLVAKGMMGALQLSQVITYLDKTKTDDNNTVVTGKGTAMQHDWDLAFGYVGIPVDYDSSKVYASTESNRPLAIGGYFRERGRYIQSGGKVYEAFRKGRAAINAKDYKGRDEAIAIIKSNLEKTIAASAWEYAALPQGSPDLAVKFHALSECYGFLLALKYRSADSPLSAANYQTMVDILKSNYYELSADATNAKLKQVQSILTAAYGKLQP
jgi:hypothetical protein